MDHEEQSIRALTSAIAAGDTAAFARFYEERFDFLLGEARRLSGRDEAFCLDIVQEACLRVIRALGPLDSEDALRAWLRRAVRSCVYDRFRREARRRRRETTRGARVTAAAAPDDLDELHDLDERLEWLRRELRSQDDSVATLLLLRHGLGWTLERIGATLGLKTGAVDGRIRRAIEGMGRHGKEEFDE